MNQKQTLSVISSQAHLGIGLADALAVRFNAKNVYLTGRGASAIYAAVKSIGKPGTFIGAPSHICPSVVMAIIAAGYYPWFLDISTDDFNLNIIDLASLPRKTTGLIAPHIYGHPLDIKAITDFCHDRNIIFIEDIAQATGLRINGKPAGCYGDIAIMSFHPSKLLPGVGGGALIFNNDNLVSIERLESEIELLPMEPEDYEIKTKEISGKVNKMLNQARDGLKCENQISTIYQSNQDLITSCFKPETELKNLESLLDIEKRLQDRMARSALYRETIDDNRIKHPSPINSSPLFRYSVLCCGNQPEKLRIALTEKLRERGIHASNLYYPTHRIFAEYSKRSLDCSELVGQRIINLWLDDQATDDYIYKTADIFKEVLSS